MRWSEETGCPEETVLQIGNGTLFSWRFRIELDLVVTVAYTATAACHLQNRGGLSSATTFAIIVEFFPCKAKLSDGSVQDIDGDTTVRLDVEFADVDP